MPSAPQTIPDPPPFACLRCATCCRWDGHVLVGEDEIDALAESLGLTASECVNRFMRLAPNRRQLALATREDGSCVFLDGNRCSVYEARPRQCRDFPKTWGKRLPCPAQTGR